MMSECMRTMMDHLVHPVHWTQEMRVQPICSIDNAFMPQHDLLTTSPIEILLVSSNEGTSTPICAADGRRELRVRVSRYCICETSNHAFLDLGMKHGTCES